MTHKLIFLLTWLFTLGGAISASAQTQVVLNPGLTMIPNPSEYVSDWQSNPQTIRLTVPIMTEQCNYKLKLMAEATLNGETVARTNPSKMEIL